MICLAFDCSGDDILVAVVDGDKQYETVKKDASGTEFLMETIKETLNKANIKTSDVECLAVGVGPGSWTGARVAVVSALGLMCGMEKKPKLIKFDSFSMAMHNINKGTMVINGFGNFVYVKKCGGEPEIIEKSKLINNSDYGTLYSTKPVGFETTIVENDLVSLTKNLLKSPCFIDENELEPMYLRKSQAEIERDKKINGNKN